MFEKENDIEKIRCWKASVQDYKTFETVIFLFLELYFHIMNVCFSVKKKKKNERKFSTFLNFITALVFCYIT